MTNCKCIPRRTMKEVATLRLQEATGKADLNQQIKALHTSMHNIYQHQRPDTKYNDSPIGGVCNTVISALHRCCILQPLIFKAIDIIPVSPHFVTHHIRIPPFKSTQPLQSLDTDFEALDCVHCYGPFPQSRENRMPPLTSAMKKSREKSHASKRSKHGNK